MLAVNYLVDPNGKREILVKRYYKPIINDRNEKYDYIFYEEKYKNYDCIILGSSRVMQIIPSKINNMTKCYNFGITVATDYEKLFIIKEWLKRAPLSEIYLGIDFYSFNKNNSIQRNNELKFKAIGSSNYLSYFTLKRSIKSIRHMITDTKQIFFNDDGSINYFKKDLLITLNKYDFSEKKLMKESASVVENNYLNPAFELNPENFEVLNKIKIISKKENINLKVFITPSYKGIIDLIKNDVNLNQKFNEIRYMLRTIFPSIYDFSVTSKANENENNFYDPWHYRNKYGEYIIETIDIHGNHSSSDTLFRKVKFE